MFNMIIVDDEISMAHELAALVDYAKYSFNVLGCFCDAESALAFIEKNHVDLIISDIKMNNINGIELLKIINSNHPHIIVVFISAYRDFDYAKLALSNHAFEYLTKPISFPEYIELLERAKKELTLQNELVQYSKSGISACEELIYDYFSGLIPKDIFTDKMNQRNISLDSLNSECSLVELKVVNCNDYLKKVWLYGVDRFLMAVKNTIPTTLYECTLYTIASSENLFTLIVTSNHTPDFTKRLNDIFLYLQNELHSILNIDVNIIEKKRCSSLFSIKNVFSCSTSYFTNTIVEHIINKDFDKIFELRDHFFSTYPLEEQQNMCIQLTDAIRKNISDEFRINTINNICLRTVTNSTVLITYFNEIVNSYKNTDERKNLQNSIIIEALRYIDENYYKEITLSSISKHVMLNASYFSNFFKNQIGECFSDFLIKIRMEHAKDMLANNPEMKIQAICESVGYKSQPYFYKTFQAYTGCSPSEFRNIRGN